MKKNILLVAVFLLAAGLLAQAEAVNFASTGLPGETATGTNITATGTDCTLNYKDVNNNAKPQVTGSDLTVTVTSMYGISGIGTPADQSCAPSSAVYYSYVVTNEGNASTSVTLATSESYGGGASAWTVLICSNETDATISPFTLAEGSQRLFRVKVTPAAGATNGQTDAVTVTASIADTPYGAYTGANGLTYGGVNSINDAATTTCISGAIALTRVATVDSPTTGRTGGGIHDVIPGAVITYTYTYTNSAGGQAKSTVLVDKVPANTYAAHVNATGASKVKNVNVTATNSTATGWTVFGTTEVTPTRTYEAGGAGWTLLGTIDGVTDWTSNEAGGGQFAGHAIPTGETFIKFQKLTIITSESGTLTWGVTIR